MTARDEPRVPRRSAQVVQHSLDDLRARRKRSSLLRTVLGLVLVVGLVYGANNMLLDRPVRAALASEARTAPMVVLAHFDHWVILPTLVLDLKRPGVADTSDLLRGLLAVGRDLNNLTLVDKVVLARDGKPVFVLSGDAFRKLGHDFWVARNQVVVLRALTDALQLPGGGKPPLEDFGDAARRWATGGP